MAVEPLLGNRKLLEGGNDDGGNNNDGGAAAAAAAAAAGGNGGGNNGGGNGGGLPNINDLNNEFNQWCVLQSAVGTHDAAAVGPL